MPKYHRIHERVRDKVAKSQDDKSKFRPSPTLLKHDGEAAEALRDVMQAFASVREKQWVSTLSLKRRADTEMTALRAAAAMATVAVDAGEPTAHDGLLSPVAGCHRSAGHEPSFVAVLGCWTADNN